VTAHRTARVRRRAGSSGLRAALAALVVLVLASACTSSTPPAPEQPSFTFAATSVSSFVTAQGRNFEIDGKPFTFVGVNVYDAAATDRYSCDPSARMSPTELADTFKLLHDRYGVTVVRFWAYQTYTDAGRDWSGMDDVISAARSSGIRLLPVLEDGPGYCTTSTDVIPKAQVDNDTWFVDGYRKQFGSAVLSYRDYAKIVVEHYRDEPVILGWSLMNEADTSARDSQNRSVLVDFATDMASVIKSADPRHLLTLGTQSNGAAGASGPDFLQVYQVPGLDFAEVHDWGYWGSDTAAMPGGTGNTPPATGSTTCQGLHAQIGCSFAYSVQLGKPLLVGEAGIDRGDGAAGLSRRAQLLGAKMTAAFQAGAGGYLLWRITSEVTDKYDILTTDQDPLLTTLAEQAKQLD
jgi:mannan endo-1,4-beta-mannosidase